MPLLTNQKYKKPALSSIIHFIWFGSMLSPQDQKNILTAQKINPSYRIELVSDSSTMSDTAFSLMKKFCAENRIYLTDTHSSDEIRQWFLYDLMKEILAFGKKFNILVYYACASDLLRMALMVYRGGYYLDCDTGKISNLALSEHIKPEYGFWKNDYYALAAKPFNPVYVLALAHINYFFSNNKEILFNNDLSQNLFVYALGEFSRKSAIVASGLALPDAIKMIADISGKHNFSQTMPEVLFPNRDKFVHLTSQSYVSKDNFDWKVFERVYAVENERYTILTDLFRIHTKATYNEITGFLPWEFKCVVDTAINHGFPSPDNDFDSERILRCATNQTVIISKEKGCAESAPTYITRKYGNHTTLFSSTCLVPLPPKPAFSLDDAIDGAKQGAVRGIANAVANMVQQAGDPWNNSFEIRHCLYYLGYFFVVYQNYAIPYADEEDTSNALYNAFMDIAFLLILDVAVTCIKAINDHLSRKLPANAQPIFKYFSTASNYATYIHPLFQGNVSKMLINTTSSIATQLAIEKAGNILGNTFFNQRRVPREENVFQAEIMLGGEESDSDSDVEGIDGFEFW